MAAAASSRLHAAAAVTSPAAAASGTKSFVDVSLVDEVAVRALFEELVSDGNGSIDFGELKRGLRRLGVAPRELSKLIEAGGAEWLDLGSAVSDCMTSHALLHEATAAAAARAQGQTCLDARCHVR